MYFSEQRSKNWNKKISKLSATEGVIFVLKIKPYTDAIVPLYQKRWTFRVKLHGTTPPDLEISFRTLTKTQAAEKNISDAVNQL